MAAYTMRSQNTSTVAVEALELAKSPSIILSKIKPQTVFVGLRNTSHSSQLRTSKASPLRIDMFDLLLQN